MYNDIAYLGKQTVTVDEYGNRVKDYEWRKVFARPNSIRQSEFYQAAQAGLKPTMMLILPHASEYDGEEVVKYNEYLYDVTRTYYTRGRMELTLTRRMTT